MITKLPAQDARLQAIRTLYGDASTSKQICNKLFGLLPSENEATDPLLLGYRGCAHMIMASHLYNPMAKLNEFSTGKLWLERAIKNDPTRVELRYLRYTVQVNTPAFLGYRKNLEADCSFLQQHVTLLADQQLKQAILDFLTAHPCH